MIRLACAAFVAAALAGCYEDNRLYCQGHPLDPTCMLDAGGDAAIDSDPGCSDNSDCTLPDLMICDTSSGACVECTEAEAGACTGATPVCGADETCRSCVSDGECASDACDTATGACFAEADVIYLTPGGAAGSCTQAAPCATFAQGLAQVAGTRNLIKAATGTYSESTVTVSGLTVTILGAGAILEPASTNQHGLFATSGANVTLQGLTIRSAGGTGVGVRCDPGAGANPTLHLQGATVSGNAGGGVTASNCTVTVESSTVSGNAGGGVSLSGGSPTLRNNWVVANGGPAAGIGGVKLDNIAGLTFEFNTVADNATNAAFAAGIQCSALSPVVLASSIVHGSAANQIGSPIQCTYSYSLSNQSLGGSNNLVASPLFVNTTTGDYHLAPTSPGIDAADPAATLAVDIDGEARPQGAGRDMGADEVVP